MTNNNFDCTDCKKTTMGYGSKLQIRFVEVQDYAGTVLRRAWLCVNCRRAMKKKGLKVRIVI